MLAADRPAGSADPWEVERLAWAVLEVLDGSPGDPLLAPLGVAATGSSRYRRCRRIADLFDRYHVHRPAMVRAWAAGHDADGTGRVGDLGGHAWQPHLWRAVRARRRTLAARAPARAAGPVAGRGPRGRPAGAAGPVRRPRAAGRSRVRRPRRGRRRPAGPARLPARPVAGHLGAGGGGRGPPSPPASCASGRATAARTWWATRCCGPGAGCPGRPRCSWPTGGPTACRPRRSPTRRLRRSGAPCWPASRRPSARASRRPRSPSPRPGTRRCGSTPPTATPARPRWLATPCCTCWRRTRRSARRTWWSSARRSIASRRSWRPPSGPPRRRACTARSTPPPCGTASPTAPAGAPTPSWPGSTPCSTPPWGASTPPPCSTCSRSRPCAAATRSTTTSRPAWATGSPRPRCAGASTLRIGCRSACRPPSPPTRGRRRSIGCCSAPRWPTTSSASRWATSCRSASRATTSTSPDAWPTCWATSVGWPTPPPRRGRWSSGSTSSAAQPPRCSRRTPTCRGRPMPCTAPWPRWSTTPPAATAPPPCRSSWSTCAACSRTGWVAARAGRTSSAAASP
ncbi:exodeoxyribonuclease V subunit gamma [Aquihabitans sp. G128]|uniref:exodeoxyribonuclease V subunit gamma n=1 Tax=Aquihabitans sp. G128 TaxID=2849779 RepID=UPI00352E2C24